MKKIYSAIVALMMVISLLPLTTKAATLTYTATANDVEASFVASNAVDNDPSTRWATNEGFNNPELKITLSQTTRIKGVEIDWERKGTNHNITAYTVSYSTDDVTYTTLVERSTNTHPESIERLVREQAVDAKYIKLNVTNFDGGTIGWRNIGVNEIRAVQENQSESIAPRLNDTNTEVVLPVLAGTTYKIVGSNADQVIDLNGKVYQPLQSKTVKISLEETTGTRKVIREYELLVPGKYTDAGQNPKPNIIPALQEWYGLSGTTTISNATTLTYPDEFSAGLEQYKEDLKERGITLGSADSNGTKIIVKKVDDKGYGKEGYRIDTNDNVITIEAATNTGAFYATRTLLQMKESITNGIIRDYPKFEHRGFMLDVGRKFVSLDYIYDFLKAMSYYKMNDFQLHLNDNLIFLPLVGETREEIFEKAPTGFRLESNIEHNGVKLTSKDHYTKEQFKKLIRDAKKLGVQIVPEFDTPGHALSFTKVRPDLIYQGSLGNHREQERYAMLDLANPQTLPFIKSMYNEMLDGDDPVLQDSTVHIGSDEYYGDTEQYRAYVDNMLKFIRDEKGRKVRLWGSFTQKNGTTPVTSENVEMHIWNTGWANPTAMLNQGYKLINITDSDKYIVPAAGYYYDYLNNRALHDNYVPNKIGNAIINESHPQMLGGAYAIWNDMIGPRENGITNYDMYDRFYKALPVIAEKNWGAPKTDYATFESTSQNVEKVPGINPYFKNDNQLELSTPTNATVNNGIVQLNGNKSYVDTTINAVGPNRVVEMNVTAKSVDKEMILAENDTYGATIYAVNKDGYIGYKFEDLEYSFDYKLIPNRQTNLKFVIRKDESKLFVDGVEIPLLNSKGKNTLVFPLQRLGAKENAFNGVIENITVHNQSVEDKSIIKRDDIESIRTNSEEISDDPGRNGSIEYAFDQNPETMWHTKWNEKLDQYVIDVSLKTPTKLDRFRYIPRRVGTNGNILTYEIEVDNGDGNYQSIASGTFENNNNTKYVTFDNKPLAKNIRLKVTGAARFGSATELTFYRESESSFFSENSTKDVNVLVKKNLPNATLVANKVDYPLENAETLAYDVRLVGADNQNISLTEEIQTSLRLPEWNELPKLFKVGSNEEIAYEVINGFARFKTTELGTYYFKKDVAKPQPKPDPKPEPSPEPKPNPKPEPEKPTDPIKPQQPDKNISEIKPKVKPQENKEKPKISKDVDTSDTSVFVGMLMISSLCGLVIFTKKRK